MNWQDEQKKVATGVTGKREWVDLTDDELHGFTDQYWSDDNMTMHLLMRVLIAKLKEKNT